MKSTIEYNSALTGLLRYNKTDKSLHVVNLTVNKVFSASQMAEIQKTYKGANRIHKPMALLFWIDCKNGKAGNWFK